MIDVDTWQANYRLAASTVGLLPWVLTIEEPPALNDPALAGEKVPDPMDDMDGFVQWKQNYVLVRTLLETSLGESGAAVFAHPLYQNLRDEPQCRIMTRIHTITRILEAIRAGPSTTAPSPLLPASVAPFRPSMPLPHTPMHPLPLSLQHSTIKRKPDSSPTPHYASKNPRQSFKVPASTRAGSATPSAQSWIGSDSGRVYSSPKPVNNQTLRDIAKTRTTPNPNNWGTRCIRCGRTEAGPDAHKAFKCQVLKYCAVEQGIITTSWKEKPTPHLSVDSGDLAGMRICGGWNWTRTVDGRCYKKECDMEHRCSLCFSEKHRAFDCDVRHYKPDLPPRPSALGPIDVDECFAQYLANNNALSTPASATSQLVRTRSQIAMPPPSLPLSFMPVASSVSSALPAPGVSSFPARLPLSTSRPGSSFLPEATATSSSSTSRLPKPRYLINDKFFDQIGTPYLSLPPIADARLPISNASSHPATPIRFDTSHSQSPYPQQYNAQVPPLVALRPGYLCRLTPAMIESELSPDWLPRFRHCMQNATVKVKAGDAKLEEQTQRDDAAWVAIHQDENSAGLVSADWDIPRMGLVGDKRMQRTDGNSWIAGLVLLAHYPPAHPSKHALCANRDGGAMLLGGGITSPSITGNFQLAFENLVPLFFDLENGEKGIVKSLIERKSNDILNRIASGASQVILSFGANPREACMNAVRRAEGSSDFEVTSITIRSRKVREWETGSMCLRTLLLRQTHGKSTKIIDTKASLFGNPNFDDKERQDVAMDEKGIHVQHHLEFKIFLVSHRDYPERCCLLFPQDHMSYATDTKGNSSLDIGTKLDIGITFAEDLLFDRFTLSLFPPPSWRFTHRKVLSLLIKDEEQERGIPAIGLTEAMGILLSELGHYRGSNVSVDYLLPKFRNLHRSLLPVLSAQGVSVNISDPIDLILAGNSRRLQRFAGNAPTSARSATPIRSAPAPPSAPSAASSANNDGHSQTLTPSTSSTSRLDQASATAPIPSIAAASTPHYTSLCECGTRSATPVNTATHSVVLKEYKIGSGSVHKQNVSKQRYNGMLCLTGIPVEERLVSAALFVGIGKRKPIAQPDTIQARVAAARRKFL